MFFTNRKVKIKKDMIPDLRPTSKAALKQQCLLLANGDLEKAQKLYDYMIKDMEDLPLYDVVPPSRGEQIKQGVSETWNWISQNQDQILTWVDVFRGLFGKKGGGGLPPATGGAANAIPPIN